MQRTAKRFFLATLLFCAVGFNLSHAQVSNFSRYHTVEETNTYLNYLATEFPEIASVETIGLSQKNREIKILTLSESKRNAKPIIYMNGAHHGNEKPSTEAVLGLIKHFVGMRHNEAFKKLLRRYSLVFHPIVNPDGHATNKRYDVAGRDPNRDYAYPNGDWSTAFRIPEVNLVKRLLDRHNVKAAVAFHSGMEGVLWPWGFADQTNPDAKTFGWLGQKIAAAMGISSVHQSHEDYPTKGEFIDYAYMTQGTLAFTVEIAKAHMPPAKELPDIVQRSVDGTLAMIDGLIEREEVLNVALNSGKSRKTKTAH